MTRMVFLHIPKTAGQSIHAALVDAFGEQAVCTARVNEQLQRMTIEELDRYQVFSGHFDWSMLDCVPGPKFVFTVLREPIDRILSFYFFLREEGARLTPEQRNDPSRQGIKAAFELSAHDYFTGGAPHLRAFLDDHYDNFYAYYFAGRHYRARSVLVRDIQRGVLTRDRVLEMARSNLGRLDRVFSVDRVGEVFDAIREHASHPEKVDDRYRVNENRVVPGDGRLERLRALGATDETIARIEGMCEMDQVLYREFTLR